MFCLIINATLEPLQDEQGVRLFKTGKEAQRFADDTGVERALSVRPYTPPSAEDWRERERNRLRDAMLAIDVTKLEAARKPGDPDDDLATRYGWMDAFEGGYAAPKGAKVITGKWSPARCQTLTEFVTYYPDETADILEQLGVCVADMYEAAPWLEDER